MAKSFNPRTGEYKELGEVTGGGSVSFEMPDEDDRVVHLMLK